jgi:hypothetical protein
MNKILEAAKERAVELEKEMADAKAEYEKAVDDKRKELRSVKAIVKRYEK